MKNVRFSQMSLEDRKKFNVKLTGILKKIMEICEENDIRWFVGYGACIGAIRHKGCIPWDDDIDVCMPRPDYDRFVDICKKRQLSDYELADINSTPYYFEHYVRMYDKNSTLYFNKMHVHVSGIFVDIFPIDGAGDGNISANYNRYCFWRIVSHFSRLYFKKIDCYNLLKEGRVDKFFLIIITSLFRKPIQKYSLKKIEKRIRKYPYENSEYCLFYIDVYGMRNLVQKKWIDETIWVSFEDIKVRVPKYYHEYLTHIYGDYMTPPPDDKKDDRHVIAYLNMERRLTLEEIKEEIS